jgi:hypothetical protein
MIGGYYMRDCLVLINYPDSDWGTDLVLFNIPENVTDSVLIEEIEYARANFDSEAYDSLQDMTDDVLNAAAESLGGTWHYSAQAGSIDIRDN